MKEYLEEEINKLIEGLPFFDKMYNENGDLVFIFKNETDAINLKNAIDSELQIEYFAPAREYTLLVKLIHPLQETEGIKSM